MTFENWFHAAHPEILIASARAVLQLSEEGSTVPFIARYRKEHTGGLDEVAIRSVIDAQEEWQQIIKRQKFILGEIEHQKKLTTELKEKILTTFEMQILEDLYLPYKQKRKTKATLAKEAGLEPLADWIWNCGHDLEVPQPGQTLELWAFTFRDEAKGIQDASAAIDGARDILVERLSENQVLRQKVRTEFFDKGLLRSEKAKKAKNPSKFERYFSFTESVLSLLKPENSHRYLAMKRGWTEEELMLHLEGPSEDPRFEQLLAAFESEACTVMDAPGTQVLLQAAKLAYQAHVFLSIENEVHQSLKKVADGAAIEVFVENARKLLLASPFGSKAVLGVDPGIRTGCKLAVVNHLGDYVASAVIHLNSEETQAKAATLLAEVIRTGGIAAVAVGNGTAGRETETWMRTILKTADLSIPVVMVSESGASVYSASETAREEFPDLDLTVRGAISIARRLQDPLAELVKIDPKSIGVGQYQHDISAHALKRNLTFLVESCVNQVGVNLNTASYHLLSYVSGIGPALARSLVEYRVKNGLFRSRQDLLKVPRLSKKVFEQAAGFLRIPDGDHPLDNTAVHPEHYSQLESMAESMQKEVKDLIGGGVAFLKEKALQERLKQEWGAFTYEDILQELEKPGRDPRASFSYFQFRSDIQTIQDLKVGMICPGIVTNVTNFGAFVDIGVHQDGLVHISQLGEKFVKDPRERVQPGDQVQVRVLEAHLEKNQISLSMRNTVEKTKPQKLSPKMTHSPIKPISQTSPIKPASSSMRKPKEAFNNPFGNLAQLRNQLKPKGGA